MLFQLLPGPPILLLSSEIQKEIFASCLSKFIRTEPALQEEKIAPQDRSAIGVENSGGTKKETRSKEIPRGEFSPFLWHRLFCLTSATINHIIQSELHGGEYHEKDYGHFAQGTG
jgi:hypothetical protein